MAITVTPAEFKIVREVLKILNDAYPPKAIPSQGWRDGKMVKFNAQQDKYFTAEKTIDVWWLYCSSYDQWRETYDDMLQCCQLITQKTGMKAFPSNVVPVFLANCKRNHELKRCFFIGQVSWLRSSEL